MWSQTQSTYSKEHAQCKKQSKNNIRTQFFYIYNGYMDAEIDESTKANTQWALNPNFLVIMTDDKASRRLNDDRTLG